jgi:hypothetical protein
MRRKTMMTAIDSCAQCVRRASALCRPHPPHGLPHFGGQPREIQYANDSFIPLGTLPHTLCYHGTWNEIRNLSSSHRCGS